MKLLSGLVFLQYRSETKRALLPNEITSIDTVSCFKCRIDSLQVNKMFYYPYRYVPFSSDHFLVNYQWCISRARMWKFTFTTLAKICFMNSRMSGKSARSHCAILKSNNALLQVPLARDTRPFCASTVWIKRSCSCSANSLRQPWNSTATAAARWTLGPRSGNYSIFQREKRF